MAVANARQVAAAEAASASRRRASSPSMIRHAARPGSPSSRPTAGPVLPDLRRRSPAPAANIIDARIHTTRDGMALDNLLVQDGQGRAYADSRLRERLVRSVEAALAGDAAAAAARLERSRCRAAARLPRSRRR